MLPEHLPNHFYDELGEENFKILVDLITARESEFNNFYPGPTKGKDGGIDSRQLVSSKTSLIRQYKWRHITKYNRSTLLSAIVSDFKTELEKHKNKSGIKFLFVTNVAFTKTTHEKFEQIMSEFPQIEIDYWDFEKLTLALRRNEDLVPRYFPIFSSQETQKIIEENKKLKVKVQEITSSEEFNSAKNQLKDLFVCDNLKRKILFPFLYLLSPLYLDERGKNIIEILLKLFEITREKFDELVDQLKSDGSIELQESLLFVSNKKRAQESLKDLISQEKFDFKIIDKFLIQ